jgi:hypothetical protein
MSTTARSTRHELPRRLLLLADEILADETVRDLAARSAATGTEVLVVTPARGGRLELWTSDDRPRRAAEAHLRRCLKSLRAAGVRAEGMVGDADSRLAIAEALRLFAADEIVRSPRSRVTLGTRPS